LAVALRAADGIGPATLVTGLICEALGSSDIREAAGWLYDQRHPVATLAALSPVIARAAQHGDAGAAKILMQAGSALARLGAAAARRVWPDGFPAVVEVAQCGGVWKAGGQLHIAFTAQLAQDLPGAHIVPPLLPPVAGALLLALRQVDACAPSPAVISRVQGQLEHR
jgi:N-acetylglucosamine kinase-like BadF-type ATPase